MEAKATLAFEASPFGVPLRIRRHGTGPACFGSTSPYSGAVAQKLHAGVVDGRWELHAHEYFSEQELFAYLASMDVNVLPYRFGTHSGWFEAALDVGTQVAAPDCGYYDHQAPSVAMFRLGAEGPNEESLKDAIQTLLGRS